MSAAVVGLWGSDLWDRYDGVVAHVNRGTEELGGGWVAEIYIAMHSQRSNTHKLFRYAKYVRERGEVEREYARALRKLVARWDIFLSVDHDLCGIGDDGNAKDNDW